MIHLAILLAALPFIASADEMVFDRYVVYEPVTLGSQCLDVRRIDVANMTFRARDPESSRQFEFRFRHGQTTRGDSPDVPSINWTTAVTRDRLMTATDGHLLRVVSISDVHDSSMTREYVSVLSCSDGTAHEVLQAGGEGLFLDGRTPSGDTIRLRWAVWRKGDCHACPSRERIQDLSWRPAFGRFAIVRDVERDFKPRSDPER